MDKKVNQQELSFLKSYCKHGLKINEKHASNMAKLHHLSSSDNHIAEAEKEVIKNVCKSIGLTDRHFFEELINTSFKLLKDQQEKIKEDTSLQSSTTEVEQIQLVSTHEFYTDLYK